MTWASIARGDYRRPANSSGMPNTTTNANNPSTPDTPTTNTPNTNVGVTVAPSPSVNVVRTTRTPSNIPSPQPSFNHLGAAQLPQTQLQQQQPLVVRGQQPPPPPTHIIADAWPMVGQTAEEARNNVPKVPTAISGSSSIGNTTSITPRSGAASGTNITTNTSSNTANSSTPSQSLRQQAAPAPRRSAWGPPDPPQRPPSTCAIAPTNPNPTAPAASPASPAPIPPLNNSIATAAASTVVVPANVNDNVTVNGVRTGMRDGTSGGSFPGGLPARNSSELHACLARVQDYYVIAFQRSPHDFLVNFFTNLAFQAGILSAGLNPDCTIPGSPRLINAYSQLLGNDAIFYVHPNAVPTAAQIAALDWVANTFTPPNANSPGPVRPQSPSMNNNQIHQRHGDGAGPSAGRQRHSGAGPSSAGSSGAGPSSAGSSGAGPSSAGPSGANGEVHRYVHGTAPGSTGNGTPQPYTLNPYTHVPFVAHVQPGFPPSVHHSSSRVTSRTGGKPIPTSPTVEVVPPTIVETLERECARMVPCIQPSEEEKRRRAGLILHLQKAVTSAWSGATVSCFGSAANGLALANGDVDMCLVVPEGAKKLYRGAESSSNPYLVAGPGYEVQVLQSIKEILMRNQMEIRSDLTHARVPILKLFDPKSNFQIDMCVNNRLVDHNTALVASYMELDDRVRPLCLLIKSWAKNRDINSTYRGTLSSYAYVLLVISFCQTRSPPVLPCLQQMVNGKQVSLNDELPTHFVSHSDKSSETPTSYNVYFDRSKIQWRSRNNESLAELLLGFFHYFAFEFKHKKSIISVRTGGIIPREAKGWDVDSVHRDAEEAEREFREDRIAHEVEEMAHLVAIRNESQRRIRTQEASTPSEEPNNGDADSEDAGKVVILSAGATPFLPDDSPGNQQVENEGPSSKTDKRTTVEQIRQGSSSKSGSVRSQDSVKSEKDEETVVVSTKTVNKLGARVAKLAVTNGTGSSDRGDSVSSSVTSADASPSVPTLRSPPRPAMPAPAVPMRDRLRKPRPVERHAFCIEDPFNLAHDLSRGADEDTIYVIREEFYRAYTVLSETGNLGNMLLPFHLDLSSYGAVTVPMLSPIVGRTIATPTPPPPLQVAAAVGSTNSAGPSSAGPSSAAGASSSSAGTPNRPSSAGAGPSSRGNQQHNHHHRSGGGGRGGYGRQRHYGNRQGSTGTSAGRGGGGAHRSRSNASGSPRHGAQR